MSKRRKTLSIEEIKEKLCPLFEEEGLQLVILFGSSVSGKVHNRSDIDIAFLFNRHVDILALTNKVIKLLHADTVDVVDLKRTSPLMKYSVVKNGILIYEREQGAFNEFYSLAFRMYIDSKKLRDAQAFAIKHFLEARGLS